ncbi:MAG: chorismate mutase [Chloroflexi bacterium]|nr:chorismate mutase [Chloroflexota bacterium]MBP7043343.1 chorismate mutase [Chloroflexota bacterium]
MKNGRTPPPISPNAPLLCRGVRGATVVSENSAEAILFATRELLYTMVQVNQIDPDMVASAYFTTTEDITATYPAVAARQLGWFDVPLLCGHEMNVTNGLPHCIRILLHWNTPKSAKEIIHVYLHEAAALRPDKEDVPPVPAEEIEMVMKHWQQETISR